MRYNVALHSICNMCCNNQIWSKTIFADIDKKTWLLDIEKTIKKLIQGPQLFQFIFLEMYLM